MGTPGGGVWKTDDAGRVWKPIFDQEQIASIGAVVVSPSNPRIVYVGTGEQTPGSGVYRSTDEGQTWVNIGLRQTHIITSIIVDPRNPDILLVGAVGDRFSGDERGIFKTTDGGKNWQKVLYKDNDTGVADVEAAPDQPNVLYATLWHRPTDPFAPPAQREKTQDAWIYRSTDEGSTWTVVPAQGLPTDPMGRVGVSVAPGANGLRVYAIAGQGLFRSEDGGATWLRSTTDPRIVGNGYFSRIFVDPRDARNIYVAQTSMYKSVDGGKTFEAWQGAPSGDDYHVIWINPADTQNMIIGVDQGAVVSVNGGKTWSSWYNQPTGQFYHVSTDQQFPYYVYGAQQDSGTAGVPSRSDFGEITYRDWAPVGGFEFAYIVVDPIDPNKIYTGGWYGTVLRYDRTTGQIVHLFVRTPKYRTSQMAPMAFSPFDPHALYVGAQYLMKSTDEGYTWQEISPDLTAKEGSTDKPNPRRDVLTTISPSPIKPDVIWVGAGNGMIQMMNGLNRWQNVTIPGLPERSNVSVVEASHYDAESAYAVVTAFQDPKPMIYRTRDSGATWQLIVNGLPDSQPARVVREDPVRKHLLYAGTLTGVYVSWDDGDHWQSLQLNLPTSTVTDLAVHGNDLVASTFGRSLWILDDVSPLRHVDDSEIQQEAYLLPINDAVRTRWDMNQDTPLPPDTPVGQNPPDGVMIDYYLRSAPVGEIKLSVYDSQNNLVREFSSVPETIDPAPPNAPEYWFASPPALTRKAGFNRFVWDLRFPPPKTLRYGYFGEHLDYIEYTLAEHAIPGETPRQQPQGPYVVPGYYSVVLSVNGKTYRRLLTVTLDPRVHIALVDLADQLGAERNISAQMSATYDAFNQIEALRSAIADRVKSLDDKPEAKDVVDSLKTLDEAAHKTATGTPDEFGIGPLNRELSRLATMIESGDSRASDPLRSGVDLSCKRLVSRLAEWRDLNQQKVPRTNNLLKKNGLAQLPVASATPDTPSCTW